MTLRLNSENIKTFLNEKVKQYNSDETRKNRNIISYQVSLVFSELDKKLPKDTPERKQILKECYQILPKELKDHFKWTMTTLKKNGIIA